MIYYRDDDILIRSMNSADAKLIYDEFFAQNWHPVLKTYESYYNEQEQGNLFVFIAEYQGNVAGYTTMKNSAYSGPFAGKGIPEIADFNVFIKYQRKGIGSKILDAAERKASAISDMVSLGVGLHYGYGSAQRMYVKRGYIPDGSGVWYKDKQLEQYSICYNNDDLVLYLSKSLRNQ